jgi:hypothetical protein
MGLKNSNLSCLKASFMSYIFCFTTFLDRPSTGAQQSHEQAQKKCSNDHENSKFCLGESLTMCELQILESA